LGGRERCIVSDPNAPSHSGCHMTHSMGS
jgi:hypothetical protein